MHEKEPIISFKVVYNGKPAYPHIKAGTHCTVLDKDDAIAQAKKCADWFNVERKAKIVVDQKTNKKSEIIEQKVSDTVEVWIEVYKDGYYLEKLSADGKLLETEPQKKKAS